jgi:SAM-dependent methyltransferase
LRERSSIVLVNMPADWQLPPGVSRALWDYFHDADLARNYDEQLRDTPLLTIDQQFVLEKCCPPGSLVDLGCGTGRLCVTLAQRGYAPVAVDLSPEMLNVTRDKAAALGLDIPCVCANLVELDTFDNASFDHAACLFSTLGMVQGSASRIKVVQHVHRMLRPGGVFVLHVHNRWFNAWTGVGRRLLLGDLWRSLIGRQEAGDYQMPPHHGIGSLTMHLFTRREVAKLLRGAGFAIDEIRPISLRADGVLRAPWWFAGLRSYGYLIAARKA